MLCLRQYNSVSNFIDWRLLSHAAYSLYISATCMRTSYILYAFVYCRRCHRAPRPWCTHVVHACCCCCCCCRIILQRQLSRIVFGRCSVEKMNKTDQNVLHKLHFKLIYTERVTANNKMSLYSACWQFQLYRIRKLSRVYHAYIYALNFHMCKFAAACSRRPICFIYMHRMQACVLILRRSRLRHFKILYSLYIVLRKQLKRTIFYTSFWRFIVCDVYA